MSGTETPVRSSSQQCRVCVCVRACARNQLKKRASPKQAWRQGSNTTDKTSPDTGHLSIPLHSLPCRWLKYRQGCCSSLARYHFV